MEARKYKIPHYLQEKASKHVCTIRVPWFTVGAAVLYSFCNDIIKQS